MRILLLAPQPFYQDRGTPIATRNLVEVLSREGHTIDVLTFHEGEDVDLPNCRIHRTPRWSLLKNIRPGFSWKKLVCDFLMLCKAMAMCRKQRWDLVQAVEESVFIAVLLKWFFRVPYVYDMDSSLPAQLLDKYWFLSPLGPLMRFAERIAVRNSKGIVVVCTSLEDIVARYSSITPVVRIEDVSLVSQGDSPSVSAEDRIKVSGPILMYVGNLQSYQGIDLLIETFVHAYHRHPTLQLVIIGGSDEDISRYASTIVEFGVADRTHFLGPRPVDRLGEYLRQADILISPRTQGTNTPMKIFSYLEVGVPVLATRLAMHTQVLNDDVAVMVPPTPLEMARGIDVLLNDREFRDRLVANARQHVREQYNSEVMDGKLAVFYEWIAEELVTAT